MFATKKVRKLLATFPLILYSTSYILMSLEKTDSTHQLV